MTNNKQNAQNLENTGFAQRLRQLRREKNLSQAELAELVDLHSSHITRYERGLSRPSADALKRMADVLGVTGDYLLSGSEEENVSSKFGDRDLLLKFQEVEKLSDQDKMVVKILLDAFLAKKQIQALVSR